MKKPFAVPILFIVICLICLLKLPNPLRSQASQDITDIKEETNQMMTNFLNYLNAVGSTDNFQTADAQSLLKRVSHYFVDTATIEVSYKNKNNQLVKHPFLKHIYPYKEYLQSVIPLYPRRFSYVKIVAYPIDSLDFKPIISENKIVGYDGYIKYKQIFWAQQYSSALNITSELPRRIKQYSIMDQTIKETHIIIWKAGTTGGSIWKIRIGAITVIDTKITN